MQAVDVRVLGPVEVYDGTGRRIDLGGRKQREVVALLAAARGAVMSADALADQLWRGVPPPTMAATLQGYVSRLRRLLEPDRAPRAQAQLLVSRSEGYALVLPPGGLDVDRFEKLVEAGRTHAAAGRHDRAVADLSAAIALWRGLPFAEVADTDAARAEVTRLDELRLTVLEDLAEARLACAGYSAAVADLRGLAPAYPLRERLHVLLARALYGARRQAEALEVLAALRTRLADELGIDPTPEVAEVERRVLRQDPELVVLPAAGPPPPRGAGGLVGRRAELGALDEVWAQVRAGRTGLALVAGEPGIGKTRLVEAWTAAAGVTTRWGRCPQAPGAPPYWPWQQVLGGLPTAAPGTDADRARFAVGLAIADHLRRHATAGPLVVALDDLQWADADSLHALEVVLHQLRDVPVLVLGTVRAPSTSAGGPLLRLLAEAARHPMAVRLDLPGLTTAEVATLLGASGHEVPPEVAARVAERTGGNPFFVRELARLDLDDVPAGVRDVVRLRLEALPAATRHLLDVLAVFSPGAALSVVAAATRYEADELGTAVAAALAAGVLVEPVRGRLRFGHDLLREVVLADLPTPRRVRLHAVLADALVEVLGSGVPVAALAVHRSEAAAGAADRQAAALCLRAATEALDRAAATDALSLCRRGLAHAVPGDPSRPGLLQLRGVAARCCGELDESLAALSTTAAEARADGDLTRVARAALAAVSGCGGFWAARAAEIDGVGDLIGQALEDLAAAGEHALDPPTRAALLAAGAIQRAVAGVPGGADLAVRAWALAEPLDTATRAAATVAQYIATWTPATAAARLALVDRLAADARGDPTTTLTASHLRRVALTECGRLAEARAESARFARLAEARHDGDALLLDAWWVVMQRLLTGEYDRALEDGARLASAGRHDASPLALELARESLVNVHGIAAWDRGGMLDLMPDFTDMARGDWMLPIVLALGQAGRYAEARAMLTQAPKPTEPGQPGLGPFDTIRSVLSGEAAVVAGDTALLPLAEPHLATYGDAAVFFWPGLTCLGSAALYHGSVLLAAGRPEEAVPVLRAALARNRALGARPYVVRTQQRLAQALRLLGTVTAEADRLEAAAHATARAIGMALPPPARLTHSSDDLPRAVSGRYGDRHAPEEGLGALG